MSGYKIKFNGVDRLYDAFSWRLTRRAKKVWESGNVLQGQYLNQLESEVAKKYNRKYAVAVASATDGLYFALKAAKVEKDDFVICPALSYTATAGAIKRIKANIDFVDVDKIGNIDVTKIPNVGKPKVLLYVNLFGNTAEYDTLRKICDARNITLIEDAAQSQGAKYKKHLSGTLGDISVFSFDPMKNMPSFGGGGMVLTDNKDYYDYIKSIRRHGFGSNMQYGHNSLISEDHCNQLLLILSKFDKLQKMRQKVFERYKNNLPMIKFIESNKESDSSFHKLVALVDNRSQLQKYLAENGIETKIHYGQTLDPKNRYLNADIFCHTALSLPIYPYLLDKEIDYICDKIKKFYNV